MNLDIIARLVRILSESPELGAIEVRRGWFGGWSSIRVTKAGHGTNAGGGGAGGEQQVAVAQAPAPPLGAGAPGSPAAPGAPPKTQLVEIKSPMVGTFYSAPEPGAPPYVKGGSRVAAGQVVCIIEAMKIMNEIEAEVSGLVREVCVENAQPVEFGQPLFRVDPHA
ncbi:MAG: acetyl-CoA carboxylase biotin carboxyl carrier protein [Gemmatimonadetes bacterium]|nr:MAG: acetyl-CoA carboxylase biotin carboxyl carrier protein [Gemmatimonadota bacterium]